MRALPHKSKRRRWGLSRLGTGFLEQGPKGLGVGQGLKNKRDGRRRFRGYALGTVSIIPFLIVGAASAQPLGASVVAGQAQVSSSGATTIINQATAKAIINWQDFSVAQGAAVQFNQPNSASITLNRVTGSNISTINGAIRANGQVWLLNPNGLLFGGGASINVGGLLATTSDLANQDFVEGRYNFSGGRNSVVNNGTIKASDGGSVVLSAPSVTNRGLIQANAGHVVLGGTDTFTVDFNGDHLLSYAVGGDSAGGKVTNSGRIQAPGGHVLLTARAASGVQDAVINNTGMIEASSAREENGEIILEADDGGVASSGTLDASGKGAGETGGTVKVLGKDIAIADGATIDVSGDAGGGTALIGGNFHGQGSEVHAQNTTIGKATIRADAISRGNGGKVAVWSDGTTKFAGSISARGGAQGGDGGRVETSGHALGVDASARVTTAAPRGTPGDWLLDPDNIIIATGGSDPATGQTYSTTGTVTIDPTSIAASLTAGSPVTLQANLDITVNDPVSAATNLTLELDAGRSIFLNASLTNLGTTGGTIVLYAGNPNATGGSQTSALIAQSAGSLTANFFGFAVGTAGGTIGTSSQPIQLNGSAPNSAIGLNVSTNGGDAFFHSSSFTTICGCGNIPTGGVNLGGGNFTLTSDAGIGQNTSLTVNDANLTSTASDIDLEDAGNAVNGTLRLTASAGNATFVNNLPVILGASDVTGTLSVTSNNFYIQIADPNGGQVHATGDVNLTAPSIITQDLGGGEIPIQAQNLTATLTNTGPSTSISLLDSSFGGPANAITGNVTFNPGSAATTIAFFNTVTTTLGAIGPVASLKIQVSDIINGNPAGINLNPGAGQGISSNGQLTLDASGDIQLVSGTGLNAPIISLTGHGGSIGFSGFSIPVNAPSGALQLSVSNLGANGSAYLTSNSPVSVVAGGLSGGSFDLRAAGDITVNSLIATSGASTLIALFSDGSLTFNASVTNTGGSIFLSANSQFASGSPASITGGGTLSAANIAIQLGGVNATGTGSIGTSSSPLQLNTSGLEVSSAGQNVFLNSQGPVTISTVDGTLGITGVDLSDGIGGFGDFSLSAAGQLTQTNPITANNITLATSGAGSSVVLGDNIAAGALTVQSAADITISANTTLTSSARGTAVLLGAVGNFINNSGAGAVNLAGGGRFLIYSADPASDVFGNLDSQNTAIFSTGYPTGIQAPGNRYVFALTPTLTVSANSVSKAYGVDTSASLPNGYTISGIQPGVVGAYLADSAASYSGTPVLTSTGAAANATVGSYAIAVSVGSFAATGYAIAFQNGTLTVTPQTLTYTANAHARLYGAANPAFSGTVSGFVNGDTLATATSGTPVFGTTATAASSVGSYAINGSGLIAANYIFAQAAGNAAALTINPAILAYVANTATRIYGAANPAFSGNVSGFVNGDTLASATSGALVFAANATAASAVGSYAINGVGLIAANYIFTQAAGNAAALTITPATLLYVANAATRTVGAADPAFGGAVNGFLNADTLSSATSGRLVFTTTATATSAAGSYAINGSGLSAANYVFAQAPGNATALTISPATDTTPQLPDAGPVITGFVAGTQPPLNPPLNTILGGVQTALNAPPPPPLPPAPPPAPPPPPGPLAANNTAADGQPAEAPNSSDQATSSVADSLEGGASSAGEGGGAVVIPKMLVNQPPPPPPPTDISALPSFGNSALWQ